MSDTMLPILRAMHDAGTNVERAEILLSCLISIMLKYRNVLESSCERHGFDAGSDYLTCFYAAMHETRYRGAVKGVALTHAQGHLLLLCDAVTS